MTRQVTAADGRQWTIRSSLEWREPVDEAQFEHEIASGRVGGVFLLIVLMALIVALAMLAPDAVKVPSWLLAAFALLVLFFPARWLIRLPWRLVAETEGIDDERPAEKWTGTVRGFFNARGEAGRVVKQLRRYDMPDHDGEGPLQPVS